jgi:hypothetical protein
MSTCAIHQPNFFPWLGYFDKIRMVDTFVFLDQVAYPKSGNSMGSWCNRVRIDVGGSPAWISCPVVREDGVQPIDMVRLDNARPWRDNLRAMLESAYRKSPNFAVEFALIDELLGYETDLLAEFNIHAITRLAAHVGVQAKWCRQSALKPQEAVATERLVAITRAVGADTYLCGGGAGGYQDDPAFARAGMGLRYQGFVSRPYGKREPFLAGLSIIDWLMWRNADAGGFAPSSRG